jgi:shikimate dehydrogenase
VIDTKTKLIALIGKPLGHSFSPRMHNENFIKLGLNYYYLPIEVKKEDIGELIIGMKKMNFVGFNVTIPNKIEIIRYLDEIDPLAYKIGAVNTVKITNGKLKGYNTDGDGFIDSLEKEGKIICDHNTFFIIGAGGASRAIAMTLAERRIKKIYIANRTLDRANDLCEDINKNIRDCATPMTLEDKNIQEIINQTTVLINTTSVGMFPSTNETPIDTTQLKNSVTVADIVYNPPETKLIREAKAIGCPVVSGIGMFINQGARAFEIWTGMQAPILEMRKSVERMIIERQQ